MTHPVVFISYSHKDDNEKTELVNHLSVLPDVELQFDDQIDAGADWETEISRLVEQAHIAILLISANFLTSGFIRNKQIPALLQRREREGLTVFPVIAKPCAWTSIDWLTKMNVRPKKHRPVWADGGSHADDDLSEIVTEIAEIIRNTTTTPHKKPAMSSQDQAVVNSVVEILSFLVGRTAPELIKEIGSEVGSIWNKIFEIVYQRTQSLKLFEEDPETYDNDLRKELISQITSDSELSKRLLSLIEDSNRILTKRGSSRFLSTKTTLTDEAHKYTPTQTVNKQWHKEADYIQNATRAYAEQIEEKWRASSINDPERPYKGVLYYEMGDQQIFYGREEQINQLLRCIQGEGRANRLTILHGISGVGKTSLLNAGVGPALLRDNVIPLYPLPGLGTRYQSPEPTIYKRITGALPFNPEYPDISKIPLHQFLQMASLALDGRKLIIFLDRFEDFFIHLSPEVQESFITELSYCYDDEALPVRFVISLRKEYFSDLSQFETSIPTIFFNHLNLEPLSAEQASNAILDPVARLRLGIRYEQELVDAILSDLGQGSIEPPQLQIVCECLYDKRSSNIITLANYEELGRARDILASHLGSVMAERFREDRPIAERILIELITAEGTKQALTRDELRAKINDEALDKILERLVNYRLLRRDEDAGEFQYELAHEYLIKEIKTWISDDLLNIKRVKELLSHELKNWQNFGTLIAPDKLKIIEEWRKDERLFLTEEEELLIERSLEQRDLEEQKQIIQAAKIMSLDQLVEGIGHEINSPIASIKSNSQFLHDDIEEVKTALEKYPDQTLDDIEFLETFAEIDQVVAELAQSADDMENLLEALNSFVGSDQVNTVIDIHLGLRIALLLLRGQLYHIKVKTRYSESLLRVNGASDQLVQLLMNILMNSIEAINRVERAETFAGVIEIKTYAEKSWVVTELSDNGTGIPEQHLPEQIFSPDFTTKEGADRGVGLLIAKQIVQRHQGNIDITSELDQGTMVKIMLPLSDWEE